MSKVDIFFSSQLAFLKGRGNKFLNFKKNKKDKPEYWLTRFIIMRLLGFVYFFAFLSLATQVIPLIGESGLMPADNYLQAVNEGFSSTGESFWQLPTIFWFFISDSSLLMLAWFGVALSIVVMVGFANSIIMFVLWALYMSFVHIGQLWYGFGWEILLLEIGFLVIFFVPLIDPRPFPKSPPATPIIWLMRWLTFRIFLGAGLIKIRGDQCWRDLTCMNFHYETQPIPNPVSSWLHALPSWWHRWETIWNHFTELVVPFFVFWPRILRIVAGVLLVSFQFFLVISGNLAFLNWITIVPTLALFDDKFLKRILPGRLVRLAAKASYESAKPNKWQTAIIWILFFFLLWLSLPVVKNLTSSRQAMNTSFNQWSLVNTYGAFGSVGKIRPELVVQGTNDESIDQYTDWEEYEFKYKPTSVDRALPIIAPYQPRIDWQIWFAAMSNPQREPWLIHLVWKLLHNDQGTLSLMSENPFPDEPPKFIKIDRYFYEFTNPWETGVWQRTFSDEWLPPLSADNSQLKLFIKQNNWETY